MGNLCWLEDHRDQALFHFERALELRSDMSPLLNNMAYLIATDEKNEILSVLWLWSTQHLQTGQTTLDFLIPVERFIISGRTGSPP